MTCWTPGLVPAPQNSSRVLRFGVFEADLRAGELRKSGIKLRLTGQPFQVLLCCWSVRAKL